MKTPFKILIIEDSEPDYFVLQKALELIEGIELEEVRVKNGQEGINYIFKKEQYAGVSTPDIIILDLNLPVKNGFEVLKCIKNDDIYKVIPVIIYSTSDETGDICASYSLYANSYLTKTSDIKELFEKIKCFGKYWSKTVKLPDDDQYCLINEEKE